MDPRRLLPALAARGLRLRGGDAGRHGACGRRLGTSCARTAGRAGSGATRVRPARRPRGVGRAARGGVGGGRRRALRRPLRRRLDDRCRRRAPAPPLPRARAARRPGCDAGARAGGGGAVAGDGSCWWSPTASSGAWPSVGHDADRAAGRPGVDPPGRAGARGRGWLVAEARDQASAAASTSRTSSSSKS